MDTLSKFLTKHIKDNIENKFLGSISLQEIDKHLGKVGI